MHFVRPATEIVERIYDFDQPSQHWLESIRSAAALALDGYIGVQTYMFHTGVDGSFRCGEIASEPEMEAAFREAHRLASPDLIRAIYQRRPVVNLGRAVAGHEDDLGYGAAVDSGFGNIVLALGIDPSGVGCALVFAQRNASGLSREVRQGLERIAAHLGSARRLRGSTKPENLLDGADAIVAPDTGALVHAERDARTPEAQRALKEAAKRVDRARARAPGLNRSEALGLWRALVDGRWSLVERFDTDGRRFFLARRNDPSIRRADALVDNERKVVALLALGHSIKLCAYELGFAQSTVSELAQSAMRKLGVRSRAELVELHGAIIDLVDVDSPTTAYDVG